MRPSHYIGWVRHIYQRARYGYSFADVWSLDFHIARILMRALREYRHDTIPVLKVLSEDRQSNGYINGAWTKEEEQAVMARWNAMIDEIIAALDAVYGEDADGFYDHAAHERVSVAMRTFADYFGAFWI